MADKPTNRNKDIKIDESILDETPPNINEPQEKDQEAENQDPTPDEEKEEEKVEEKEDEGESESELADDSEQEVQEKPKTDEKPPVEGETQEQKDKRYKAQQTEAQIQAARNRAITDKVDEASKIPEPTIEELKSYVALDGVDWDELTAFEQSMAKKTYLSEKRFTLVNDAVQETKKIDEWAQKVDTFIDSTDGKPEFVELSSHEADFRKFAMQESHRGTPIDILLSAFLHNLPPKEKKRGSLFEHGGGGEKIENQGKITDADAIATLRTTNPREYKRLLRAGKITPEL